MYILQDHDDEFRIVSFILELKGMQFITVGVLSAVIAAVQYLNCVNLQGKIVIDQTIPGRPENYLAHTCNAFGPGQAGGFYFYIEMGFFILQTLLVYLAFMRLPYTIKKGMRKLAAGSSERKHREPDPDDSKAVYDINCCGCRTYAKRGGQLRSLIYYELATFVIVIGLGIAGVFTRFYRLGGGAFIEWEWQFKADIYWLKTLYGLLSFPFAIFILPGLSNVLLHVRPTAYNRAGQCVPVVDALKEAKKKKKEEEKNNKSGSGATISIVVEPKV
jgi:hypothetical protein